MCTAHMSLSLKVLRQTINDDLGTMPTRRPYSWKKKAEREGEGGFWLVQLNFPPRSIVEADFVE